MAENKTKPTDKSVTEFIEEFANSERKKQDSYKLLELMEKISGRKPYMWGPSIIGFGSYHYKYESGHEGDAPLLGFSPRKSAISLYVFTGLDYHKHLLDGLGKYKMGKACMYVNKLDDIDLNQLEKLMKTTMDYMVEKYPAT